MARMVDGGGYPRIMRVGEVFVLLHEGVTKDIIGAAMAVLNALKPGLDEKLYENALVLELKASGHAAEQQCRFPVQYRGALIGTLVPDLIVDAKVVSAFNDAHVAQMTGYLAITGLQVGLLINFKDAKLTWKRVVREQAGAPTPTSAPSA